MGLQKELTLDSGIYLPEAYIEVISCSYINNFHTNIKVYIYKDYTAKLDGKSEVVSFTHLCVNEFQEYFGIEKLNEPNINIIKQSYEWIKTLDFYKDAIEVPTPK